MGGDPGQEGKTGPGLGTQWVERQPTDPRVSI